MSRLSLILIVSFASTVAWGADHDPDMHACERTLVDVYRVVQRETAIVTKLGRRGRGLFVRDDRGLHVVGATPAAYGRVELGLIDAVSGYLLGGTTGDQLIMTGEYGDVDMEITMAQTDERRSFTLSMTKDVVSDVIVDGLVGSDAKITGGRRLRIDTDSPTLVLAISRLRIGYLLEKDAPAPASADGSR